MPQTYTVLFVNYKSEEITTQKSEGKKKQIKWLPRTWRAGRKWGVTANGCEVSSRG